MMTDKTIQELEQNWKNYRTMINDHPAIISVNMDMFEDLRDDYLNKVAAFSQPYDADEEGLPKPGTQENVLRNLAKILTQLNALNDVLYAGHIISNGEVKLYFYIEYPELFIETAKQFVAADKITIQEDPEWDIYFDFLLPSKVEVKFDLTEEILNTIAENGLDLSQTYYIEHRFHFDNKDDMDNFIEQCRFLDISFTTIKYTDTPVQLENMPNEQYLLKLEQEIPLDTQDIFKSVELFEEMARDYHGEYTGWESIDPNEDKKYVN